MYTGNNRETYGGLEESVLACLLLEPSLMGKLIVEEKHFKKFGYVLTFMKEFYAKYQNFDISLMLSLVKGTSQMTLIDTITYLLDIFVIPTHFMEYQNTLIEFYKKNKKEEWLRGKIYEKATKLYVGSIDIETFNREISSLYRSADKIEWK